MKLQDLPKEKPRVDLATLPPEQELIALSESMQDKTAVKTGGLVITFKQKDGKEFKQKYSAMHSEVLSAALRDIGLKDTIDLQHDWRVYKLTQFRMGFPRYIPTRKGK